MHLSIIIPAYNEADRIEKTLREVDAYLQEQQLSYEVLVVDDGSTDGTENLIKQMSVQMPYLSLIQFPKNQGKGAAVKAGMLAVTGDLRLFMDADGSTHIRELTKLLPYAAEGFEVVVGSRLVAGAVKKTKQNLAREFLGWVFRNLTRLLMHTEVQDPQNGFKLFSANAAERIFGELTTNGWSFDVEVFALAKKHGLKVKEVPIVWVNDERSRIRFPHMLRMLVDLVWIRLRY